MLSHIIANVFPIIKLKSKYYSVFYREEKKIQRDALRACRKEGGDLASIHSIEEFDFIISQLGYGKNFHL